MGGKYPIDYKGSTAFANTSICNAGNRYGYRYNINHPKIRPLYDAYKKRIGLAPHIHPTHRQRLHFESVIDRMIYKEGNHVQSSDPDGTSDP